MSQPFIGQIALFPYDFAPHGWAFCQGQILPISQNTALFALLGTNFGGNGTTTFALPDLRGRVPIGAGQGPGLNNYTLAEQAGSETKTLLLSEMPSHTHVVSLSNVTAVANVKNGLGNKQSPVGNVPAAEASGVTATYSNASPDAVMANTAVTLSGNPTVSPTGSSHPFDLRTPYLVMNYCIALQGIFPSRN